MRDLLVARRKAGIVVAYNLVLDADLLYEKCAEVSGVGKQQSHLPRIAQLRRHSRFARISRGRFSHALDDLGRHALGNENAPIRPSVRPLGMAAAHAPPARGDAAGSSPVRRSPALLKPR
jgi:hypothetical protein